MLVLLAAVASAAPFQLLHPTATLDPQQTVMGAAVGVRALASDPSVAEGVFSGWARYGLDERVEVLGGAALSTAGLGVVVSGGVRARALGDAQGLQLSTGAMVFSGLDRFSPFGVTVPVQVGWTDGAVDVFAGASPTLVPLGEAGVLWGLENELGLEVDVASFPAWVALTHRASGGAHVVGLALGAGYDLAQ